MSGATPDHQALVALIKRAVFETLRADWSPLDERLAETTHAGRVLEGTVLLAALVFETVPELVQAVASRFHDELAAARATIDLVAQETFARVSGSYHSRDRHQIEAAATGAAQFVILRDGWDDHPSRLTEHAVDHFRRCEGGVEVVSLDAPDDGADDDRWPVVDVVAPSIGVPQGWDDAGRLRTFRKKWLELRKRYPARVGRAEAIVDSGGPQTAKDQEFLRRFSRFVRKLYPELQEQGEAR